MSVLTELLFQSASFQIRLVVGVLAAELAVLHHAFVVAAFLQAILAERSSQLGIEEVTGGLEVVEGIFVQYLGPSVSVITGTVATVENMGKVGATITGQDFWHQADGIHLLLFEGVHIEVLRLCQFVELHVKDGSSNEFGSHEALVEQGTVLNLVNEAVGHDFASLVVFGVHADDLGFGDPVLHDL